MSGGVALLREDFEPVQWDSDKFNMLGLPRIDDTEHMRRALGTDNPHRYIADRAGTMNFEGEDGTGFDNAVDMHISLLDPKRAESYAFFSKVSIHKPEEALSGEQIEPLLSETSFHAALNRIGYENLPGYIQDVLDNVPARDYKSELAL